MSKEQRQKTGVGYARLEKKDSRADELEEEIRFFVDYEKRIRAEIAESFKKKDLFQGEYSREVSTDDDYRSSSVRDFDDVRSVRSVKGKRRRFLRAKHGFRSRHRKARPKRKRIREMIECPSRNYEICETCCPLYEGTRPINDENVGSFAGYLIAGKRRSKMTYPASRLLKRYSSRLISPKPQDRYFRRARREWQSVDDSVLRKDWQDQPISTLKNGKKNYLEYGEKSTREKNCVESLKKRSTDSIYMNPRFERSSYGPEASSTFKKEAEVRSCVRDKTNESSFQKRLSGGSNFSCSTNNQYCPRLDGPSSCEDREDGDEDEEDEMEEPRNRKGANKSRSPKCERQASMRTEEKKICGKFDWNLKDSPCLGSGSRYCRTKSFSSLSSTRSTKGVTFEGDVSENPARTPRRGTRCVRKSEKTCNVDKKVHYEPKCLKTGDRRKDKQSNECCFCKAEKFDERIDGRNRKLCRLVRSKEAKQLLECCCTEDEKEDNEECNELCRCPENLKLYPTRQRCDSSKTYERSWKGKNILHSTSLPGTSFTQTSSTKLLEDTCKKRNDRTRDLGYREPEVSLSDHWKKCRERLEDFNEEYRKLSNDVKTIREIYCIRDDARKGAADRLCSSALQKGVPFDSRRCTDYSDSPCRPNGIEKCRETDRDCSEIRREVSPCSQSRYARSCDRRNVKRETDSKRKLEKDSVRKLENFCDRVKAVNRRAFESKPPTNPVDRTSRIDRKRCDCRCESEQSVQELWRPTRRSKLKEWPVGNSVDLRILRPKRNCDRTNHERILIYPPKGAAGPPLMLFKNSSNMSCQVKGDAERGFRYNVTYIQRFVSPCWRPIEDCLADDAIRRGRNRCDCSSDYG